MLIRPSRPWQLPDNALTDESAWLSRRALIAGMGAAGLIGACDAGAAEQSGPIPDRFSWKLPNAPYERNPKYTLDRPITDERVAGTHNNFYEFTTNKSKVWELAAPMTVRPWTVKITGEVARERTVGLGELLKKLPIEERAYRFRCVEAWSMAVPWLGIPMSSFIKFARPLGNAKYVRFVTLNDPSQMPGVKQQPWYKWPYYEGLSMAEANNELAILAVGIYGHPLPNQHGAPIRLIVPWKYGFKSIKSIVRVEFLERRPRTFWNDLAPREYDFAGNVRPDIPHPRWSQATERIIPTGDRVATLMYNGYAEQVAHLYG